MGFVSDFINSITNVVESAVASNASSIASAISPVFAAAVGLYIVYVMYEILYTQHKPIIGEVFKNISALAVVGAFTYSAPYYSTYVIPFVMHAGSDLSSAVSGSGDTASSVDSMWESLSSTMNSYLSTQKEALGLTDVGDTILVYIVWGVGYIGGALLIYYSAVFLCISTFAVGIALSAGIIFICFAFFPLTRKMFTAWCGTCLNYILLNVFYTISFSFLIALIKKTTSFDSGVISISDVLMLLLTIMVSIFLIEHIGVMSSTLTGGVGINGLTPAANGAISKAATLSGGRAMAGVGRNFAGNISSRAKSSIGSYSNRFKNNSMGG